MGIEGKDRGPIFVQVSRSEYAQMIWRQRAVERVERKMPDVMEAVKSKVEAYFKGVNLAKPRLKYKRGIMDITVKDNGDERFAIARINGMEAASLGIWKRPDTDSFSTTDESSRIYTLYGISDNNRIALSYHTESVDSETGETIEAGLLGNVIRPNDIRHEGRYTQEPLEILEISRALSLKV